MSPVLCFHADKETADLIESLRIVHTKEGDVILRPRSEVLEKFVKLGLEHYEKTDVERGKNGKQKPP